MTLQDTVKSTLKRIATSPFLRPFGRPILRAVQYALSLHHPEVMSAITAIIGAYPGFARLRDSSFTTITN